MNNEKMKKLLGQGQRNAKYFKHLADPLVENFAEGVNDMVDDEKLKISFTTATNMAMGAAVTRNGNILVGVAIGSVGTLGMVLAGSLYSRFKNRKNAEEKEVAVTLGNVITPEFEDMLASDKEKVSKQTPKKDMGDLADIITEIDKHGKKVKK